MKKFIVALFALITFTSFYIADQEIVNTYITDILYIPSYQSESTSFTIRYSQETNDISSFKENIVTYADEYDVSLMKYKNSLQATDRSAFLYLEHPDLFKDCGFVLEDITKFNNDMNAQITNNRELKDAVYFPNYTMSTVLRFVNFRSTENKSADGSYTVVGKNRNAFIAKIKAMYPNTGIQELQSQSNESLTPSSPMESPAMKQYVEYMFLIGITTIVCLLIYFSNQEKKLAIKKLHGFSNLKMLYKENWSLLGAILVTNILIYSILLVLQVGSMHKYTIMFLQFLVSFMLIEILLLGIIFCCLYFYFKHITYASILKNKHHNHSLFILNFVLRMLILLYCVTSFSQQVPLFTQSASVFLQQTKFQEKVSSYQNISYIEHELQDEKVFPYLIAIYQELDKQGAIGMEVTNYNSEPKSQLPFLIVNANYINTNDIVLSNGTPFRTTSLQVEDQPYILVPQSIHTLKAKEIMSRFQIEEDHLLVIKDKQDVFTFSTRVDEVGLGVAKEPIIMVSGFINTEFLYLENSQLDTAKLSTSLLEQGFPDGIGFQASSNRDADVFAFVKMNVIDSARILFFDAITLLLVVTQLVSLFMHNKKKELAIKKMNGYSKLRRFEDLFMIQMIFYVVDFAYILLLKKDFSMMPYLMGILAFEFLYTYALIIFDDRKSVIEKLKEK